MHLSVLYPYPLCCKKTLHANNQQPSPYHPATNNTE